MHARSSVFPVLNLSPHSVDIDKIEESYQHKVEQELS